MYQLKYLLTLGLLWIGGGLSVSAQAEEPDINAYVFVDSEPVPTNLSEIRQSIGYPQEAINENISGTVVVRVLVDTVGKYVRHKVVNEVHPALSAAVAEQLPQITFEPARQNGKALMFWINLPFPFKLLDEDAVVRKQIEALTEQLGSEPENYELWQKRGIQRSQVGDFEDAVVDFTESLRLNPRKNKKKKEKNTYEYLVYAHYSRAAVYNQLEKYQEAIEDYNQALAFAEEIAVQDSGVEATRASIFLERGYTYALMEQYGSAKEDYRQAMQENPDQNCEVYPLLADIGLIEDNFSELVETYSGLISCKPEDILLYYSRGFYKLKSGDPSGAIEDFAVIEEKSRSVPLLLATYNHKALAYLELKQWDQAEAAIQKALDINILNAQSYLFAGKVAQAKGDQEKACIDWQKALDFGLEGEELSELTDLRQRHCGVSEE